MKNGRNIFFVCVPTCIMTHIRGSSAHMIRLCGKVRAMGAVWAVGEDGLTWRECPTSLFFLNQTDCYPSMAPCPWSLLILTPFLKIILECLHIPSFISLCHRINFHQVSQTRCVESEATFVNIKSDTTTPEIDTVIDLAFAITELIKTTRVS